MASARDQPRRALSLALSLSLSCSLSLSLSRFLTRGRARGTRSFIVLLRGRRAIEMRRARHDRGSHPQLASTRPARTVCLPAHHTALLARVREWRHGRVTQFRREPRSHRPLRPRTSPPQRPPRPSWNRRVQEGGRRPLSWTLRLRPPSWTPWSSTRELPSHRHPGAALTRAPPLPCSAACLSPFLSRGRSLHAPLPTPPRPLQSPPVASPHRPDPRTRYCVYAHATGGWAHTATPPPPPTLTHELETTAPPARRPGGLSPAAPPTSAHRGGGGCDEKREKGGRWGCVWRGGCTRPGGASPDLHEARLRAAPYARVRVLCEAPRRTASGRVQGRAIPALCGPRRRARRAPAA